MRSVTCKLTKYSTSLLYKYKARHAGAARVVIIAAVLIPCILSIPKKYVDLRVMSWVAFDRALRLARLQGLPAPLDEWTKASAEIYNEVMEKGWSEKKGSFVQAYGSDALDASALLMVLVKFISPTDPLMLSTIERIQRELSSGALVHRYSPNKAKDDGLGNVEGTFNACSFWLTEALARAGRVEEARFLLEKLLSYSNEVGLYSEKLSPTGQALGNFPQALTHLALISACHTLDQALNEKYRTPQGEER